MKNKHYITFKREAKDCTVCLVNKINTVVLPCKHMCLCVDCANNLIARNDENCPMCRNRRYSFLKLNNIIRH